MPSRNTVRTDLPDSYYHVYARGANRQPIFLDQLDFDFFVSLFARYLSKKQTISRFGEPYPNFRGQVTLLAYCLMGNHFHLMVHQADQGSLAGLMKSIMTSYSRHFNNRYKRTGSLFENRYKASLITSDEYLQHISRYIHLNPRSWKRYPNSSIRYYRDGAEPDWINTTPVLTQFDDREEYLSFVTEYKSRRDELEEIKHELADQ